MRSSFWARMERRRDEAHEACAGVTGGGLSALRCHWPVRGGHGSRRVRLRRRLLVQASCPEHLPLGVPVGSSRSITCRLKRLCPPRPPVLPIPSHALTSAASARQPRSPLTRDLRGTIALATRCEFRRSTPHFG